jgi:hypothetical protein
MFPGFPAGHPGPHSFCPLKQAELSDVKLAAFATVRAFRGPPIRPMCPIGPMGPMGLMGLICSRHALGSYFMIRIVAARTTAAPAMVSGPSFSPSSVIASSTPNTGTRYNDADATVTGMN